VAVRTKSALLFLLVGRRALLLHRAERLLLLPQLLQSFKPEVLTFLPMFPVLLLLLLVTMSLVLHIGAFRFVKSTILPEKVCVAALQCSMLGRRKLVAQHYQVLNDRMLLSSL
jgi:hypothetical protein